MEPLTTTFDPVALSVAENEFVIRHLGEPWSIAGRDIHPVPLTAPHRKDRNPVHYPDGVTPAAVRPVIDRVYELLDLEKHHGESWEGVEAIKMAAQVYIDQCHKWERDKLRGAPRFPSMHSFDSKGRPFKGGPGSDTGRVQTYFDKDGNRQKFAVEFVKTAKDQWMAEWAQKAGTQADQPEGGLTNDTDKHRWECFCGHTEAYKVESRQSFNMARGRMSRHLRTAKDETFRHREIHTANFGSRGGDN